MIDDELVWSSIKLHEIWVFSSIKLLIDDPLEDRMASFLAGWWRMSESLVRKFLVLLAFRIWDEKYL